jgi:hypothetical protein
VPMEEQISQRTYVSLEDRIRQRAHAIYLERGARMELNWTTGSKRNKKSPAREISDCLATLSNGTFITLGDCASMVRLFRIFIPLSVVLRFNSLDHPAHPAFCLFGG